MGCTASSIIALSRPEFLLYPFPKLVNNQDDPNANFQPPHGNNKHNSVSINGKPNNINHYDTLDCVVYNNCKD